MLERLADIIRPALSEKSRDGFEANEAMMSIMGCSADELGEILTALGYEPIECAPKANTPEPMTQIMQATRQKKRHLKAQARDRTHNADSRKSA